jgi:hypothetical protein
LSIFNPASAEAGIALPSIAMFVSDSFHTGEQAGYKGALSVLCHKCMTQGQQTLNQEE